MRKILFFVTLISALSFSVQAQKFKPLDKSPLDMIEYPSSGQKKVRVIYSRPQLRGRQIADIVQVGELWRTGANESTEITFYESVTFGGKLISPGSYTLYSIPNENQWTIIINTATHSWGTYSYNESNDVARVKVPVTESRKSVEALSMTFEKGTDGVNLHIGWDDIRVSIPIKLG
tara:strand:+ start:139 stop:666 length:528 start_codon:yes stop_codon:yes gene_type:complete